MKEPLASPASPPTAPPKPKVPLTLKPGEADGESGPFVGALLPEEESPQIPDLLSPEPPKAERPSTPPFVEIDPELLAEAMGELEAVSANEPSPSAEATESSAEQEE